jgi:hypothetical protein
MCASRTLFSQSANSLTRFLLSSQKGNMDQLELLQLDELKLLLDEKPQQPAVRAMIDCVPLAGTLVKWEEKVATNNAEMGFLDEEGVGVEVRETASQRARCTCLTKLSAPTAPSLMLIPLTLPSSSWRGGPSSLGRTTAKSGSQLLRLVRTLLRRTTRGAARWCRLCICSSPSTASVRLLSTPRTGKSGYRTRRCAPRLCISLYGSLCVSHALTVDILTPPNSFFITQDAFSKLPILSQQEIDELLKQEPRPRALAAFVEHIPEAATSEGWAARFSRIAKTLAAIAPRLDGARAYGQVRVSPLTCKHDRMGCDNHSLTLPLGHRVTGEALEHAGAHMEPPATGSFHRRREAGRVVELL